LLDEGELIGDNTDRSGAIHALCSATAIEGQRVVVLGAGGAGRAVAHGVSDRAGSTIILNRTESKAQQLADELGVAAGRLDDHTNVTGDIVINCTSVGMKPDDSVVTDTSFFEGISVAMDVVVASGQTRFLELADRMGCTTIGGHEMYGYQAADAFELWTGQQAQPQEIANILTNQLQP
jgi:shikimate dehydrogenase